MRDERGRGVEAEATERLAEWDAREEVDKEGFEERRRRAERKSEVDEGAVAADDLEAAAERTECVSSEVGGVDEDSREDAEEFDPSDTRCMCG